VRSFRVLSSRSIKIIFLSLKNGLFAHSIASVKPDKPAPARSMSWEWVIFVIRVIEGNRAQKYKLCELGVQAGN